MQKYRVLGIQSEAEKNIPKGWERVEDDLVREGDMLWADQLKGNGRFVPIKVINVPADEYFFVIRKSK